MTETTCTSCRTRPTSATLCGQCSRQLEDSLAALASWARDPDVTSAWPWCDLATRTARYGQPLPTGNHAVPSSVFDSPSSRAALGGTKGLASELDTQRSRQSRRGDQSGPRLAPDSKVWAPSRKLDRIERDLARAVALWVGRLSSSNVVIPRAVATGHVLARGCTILLWHAHDVAVHPDAADAVRAFSQAADAIELLLDTPDMVYVGPCNTDSCQEDLHFDRDELEVRRGSATTQCRACGAVHNVEARRAELRSLMDDRLASEAELGRWLAIMGLTVSGSQIRTWVDRGRLVVHSRRALGQVRSVALYRVGEVMTLAVRADEDARSKRKKISA